MYGSVQFKTIQDKQEEENP